MSASIRRHAAGAAAAAVFALAAPAAHASHFRYATMRWEQTALTATSVSIRVTTESAWRISYGWPGVPTLGVPLNTGNVLSVQTLSGATITTTPLMVTPSSFNVTEDWFVGGGIFNFTVPRTALPLRVFFQNCCRISTLQDANNDQDFRVETIVSADTTNTASPSASFLPIVTLAHGLPAATFFIPASDVDGDPLTYSISPLARSLLIKAAPDGSDNAPPPTLTVNPATGQVTWATNLELLPPVAGHFYAVQFLIRDSRGGETPLDALLRLVPNVGTAPVALVNGSPGPASFAVNPGTPVSFTLRGIDPDAGASVTLTSGGLPPGASFSPSLPSAGTPPRDAIFNWTPTLAQAGNTYVVSVAATDNLGLQDTNSVSVTVLANFPPTVTCPVPSVVEATGPTGASASVAATVNDSDGDALTVRWYVDSVLTQTDSVPAGAGSTAVNLTHDYGLGLHALRVEVQDGITALRQCTSSVDVVDTTGPVLSLPANQTLEATGPGGAVATWPDPVATDVVDGDRPVTCLPASGSLFSIATTIVQCSASDSRGNSTSGTFDVTVADTTPPVISGMPPNLIREAASAAGAVATWADPTASDVVAGVVAVACAPASGSVFALGTTPVVCTATDGYANSASQSFDVTVVDTTPPVIAGMPANLTREATSGAGASVTWADPTANDSVDGAVAVTCVPASGSSFALGTTPVACSTSDSHGNASSQSFEVTVVDTTPPAISGMPANQTHEATSAAGVTVSWSDPAASDVVDGPVAVACAAPSGSSFALGTTAVTCTASDAHGNSSSQSFDVTVQDTTPPVLAGMPPNLLAEATSAAGASVSWVDPTASDLVDGPVAVVCAPPSGITFPLATTLVVCTATDAHGNASGGSFSVTVQDTTPPVISGMPADQTHTAALGASSAVVSWPDPTASDAVDGPVAVTCAPASGSTFALGATLVTCSAADVRGNAASQSFSVTVVSVTPRANKLAVRAALAALLPTGNRKTDKAIKKALDHIDDSLKPSLWADASHLTRKGGKVFEEEEDAVEELMEIHHPSAGIGEAIAGLVAVDRLLAEIAIEDAKAADGNRHPIERAEKELRQGDKQAGRGHFGHAIQEYKEAWYYAQRALRSRPDHDHHDHDCDRRDRGRR